jgi:hypothetical protein
MLYGIKRTIIITQVIINSHLTGFSQGRQYKKLCRGDRPVALTVIARSLAEGPDKVGRVGTTRQSHASYVEIAFDA